MAETNCWPFSVIYEIYLMLNCCCMAYSLGIVQKLEEGVELRVSWQVILEEGMALGPIMQLIFFRLFRQEHEPY